MELANNPFVDDPLLSIERDIIAWHRATFPDVTVDDIETKFYEERGEFEYEVDADLSFFSDDAAVEFADMCIVYMTGLAKLGKKPLSEIIKDKMAINRTRKWNKNGERV
jgi:hypothetical protein